MVEDHKDDIDLCKKEAENGKDAEIKSWAAGKLPTASVTTYRCGKSQIEATKNAPDSAGKK
jgi:hypothetical protein